MLSFIRAFLLTGLPILVFVSAVEYFWKASKHKPSEFSRKFIHITVGTYAAFWPLFISWRNIELLGIGALCALIVSRTFNVYKSIHFTRKHATGEFLSATSITLAAFITHDSLLFAVGILHLSLADGFAAVLGNRWGKNNKYKILGSQKSVFGTAAFFVISFALVSIYVAFSQKYVAWPTLIWVPLLATLAENVGVAGSDNITVPLVVVLALRWL